MKSRICRGFSLVELMIAMVLGLVIIGGAVSMFLANKQTYRTTENLSRVGENVRMAFELMARDVREAGATSCGNSTRVANVVNGGGNWWADWGNAVRGYDGAEDDPAVTEGAANGNRVVGTDSIQILGIDDEALSIDVHNPTSAQFKLNEPSSSLTAGDIVIACDPDHAAIFQITNYNNNVTLVHNTGTGKPGNCSKGLGFPTECTTNGNPYTFGKNSQLAKLSATDWYVGNNGRAQTGGRSLYRMRLNTENGEPKTTAEEMVDGVRDMQISYLRRGATQYVPASGLTTADWANVIAVRIAIEVESPEATASTTANQRLVRSFTHYVNIRNRAP